MADAVFQDLSLGYQCQAARLAGAERGRCDCPCHEMTEADLDAFLRFATGDTGTPPSAGAS